MTVRSVVQLPVGADAVLVTGSSGHQLSRRLAELGLRTGSRFRVLSRTAGGGRVLAVAGSRIALDRATATVLQATTDANRDER